MATSDTHTQPVVIGVVGFSGSGKTTLLECLIPALVSRGLKVGAVKHSSHGFLADRPGKDSHRLYESGARAVALVSHEQLVTFVRVEQEVTKEVSLRDALDALPRDLDVILVEGFSWKSIPRIVLFQAGGTPASEHLERGEVLAKVEVPTPAPGEQPTFPDDLIASLTQTVVAQLPRKGNGSRRVA